MAVESHDKSLDDLLKMVESGKAQLPELNINFLLKNGSINKASKQAIIVVSI